METEVVIDVLCPSCRSPVAPTAEICPKCGAMLGGSTSTWMPPSDNRAALQSLLDHRGLLLLVLFGATAGLGLPLLWKSRVFSRSAKILLSIALCVYTALIFYLFWRVMSWSLASIRDSLG
ncbi:MAG: hypothetical protein KJ000_05635 [Pirellulaceae bacterium]|nr:hypothetical protein [Pirellulaceae bacterium]